MRNKLTTLGMAATLVLGGVGVAGVAKADPDPNGPAKKGLCTAYFNGQKKGHDNNGYPGPFQALVDAAGDDGVLEFCSDVEIGGNPDHGRFPQCFDGDDETSHPEACPE